jgi:hypothetical protein
MKDPEEYIIHEFSDFAYTWQQAVRDGLLVEILKHRWPELANGKPLLATSHLSTEISLAGLMEIWTLYVEWVQNVMPTLKEEDRLFSTKMNSKTVWAIGDGMTFMIMYPEDY